MPRVTHYTLKDFDTLESIAGRYLGSPDRWIDIVQNNNLRYPFISDDPKDHLGTILTSGILGSPLLKGDISITIQIDTPQLAQKGSAFHISQTSSYGVALDETKYLDTDAAYQATGQATLTFTTPMQHSFDEQAQWVLVADPDLQVTRVLRPGDTVLLYDANIADKIDNTEEFARVLGSDLSLDDETRQLRWDSTAHDFLLTRGVENLAQAVRLKIMTSLGDLPYHPEYGNRLLQYIGIGATAIFAQVATGLIKECIMEDPRVFGVENVSVVIQGDICIIDLAVRVRGLDSLVEITGLGIELR